MARPWKPKEPRRPKPTFYVKPKTPKSEKIFAKAHLPENKDPYQDGYLRMYLDDERPCPPGFTLYRSVKDFKEALESADLSKLYAISLDWYLGVGVKESGMNAAEIVAELLREKRDQLENLHVISCHSSDTEKGAQMARIIAAPIRNDRDKYPYIYVNVGSTVGKL